MSLRRLKQLGEIFQWHGAHPAADAVASPNSAAHSEASVPHGAGANAVATASAPSTGRDASSKMGPRSSWDAFLLAGTDPMLGAERAVPLLEGGVRTTVQVLHQNLDVLMREVVVHVKQVLKKMDDGASDVESSLSKLYEFVNLMADKLQESGGSSLACLREYFASSRGHAVCEQTALVSLILDVVNRIRLVILRCDVVQLQLDEELSTRHKPAGANSDMRRAVIFLMSCVEAIVADAHLMDKFRCEIPSLVFLTADEHSQSALFIRDLAMRALAAISSQSFNAALVWYLHDCGVISKTVHQLAMRKDATMVTADNAAEALGSLLRYTKTPFARDSLVKHDPIATAVSDALGFIAMKAKLLPDQEETRQPAATASQPTSDDFKTTSPAECFSVFPIDPIPAFKALVYILQKTCRFSLVLLGEFQSSGGYELLSALINDGPEEHVPMLLDFFALLLPLGTGFAGCCGSDDGIATIFTCGGRNAGAFVAVRDLTLECMTHLKPHKQKASSDNALSSRHERLVLQLLTTILQIYSSSFDNFVCLEPKTQTLAMLVAMLPSLGFYDVHVLVMRIAEYVCVSAPAQSSHPAEILSSLGIQFVEASNTETIDIVSRYSCSENASDPHSSENAHASTDSTATAMEETPAREFSVAILLCECIIRILQQSNTPAFKTQLVSCGLLERGVYGFFVRTASALSSCSSDFTSRKELVAALSARLVLWSSLASLMLRDDEQMCVELRQLQIHQSLYAVAEAILLYGDLVRPSTAVDGIASISTTPGSFSIFAVFIELAACIPTDRGSPRQGSSVPPSKLLLAGIEADLTKILELMQSVRGQLSRQLILLEVVKRMLQRGGSMMQVAWQDCQGHEVLVALLSSAQMHTQDDRESDGHDDGYVLMDLLLDVLGVILDASSSDDSTRRHFKKTVGYSVVASCLITSGVLTGANLPAVLKRVFAWITGLRPPRNKIRNANAVQVVFILLPHLPVHEGEACLQRLLAKIDSYDDDTCLSRQQQVVALVEAGIFEWLAEPALINLLGDNNTALQPLLKSLITKLAREEMATRHLRQLVRVVAQGMPLLLGNAFYPSAASKPPTQNAEVGLDLLLQLLHSDTVPSISVGIGAAKTPGYVQVVSHRNRIWPPPNGYSFACWLRLPPKPDQVVTTDLPCDQLSPGSTVCVALCEGLLTVRLDGDDTDVAESYGVLVGAELTLFRSSEGALRNDKPAQTLIVTAVAAGQGSSFFIWSQDKRYIVQSPVIEMWLRALQQSECISNRILRGPVERNARQDDVLFVDDDTASPEDSTCSLGGVVCLAAMYSLEAPACFTRIYFDQATGCLRVDTGAATGSSNVVNPTPKHTSVLFKNVNVNLFTPQEQSKEAPAQWHHVAVVHRKATIGSSVVTLFVDGAEVATKRLSFPSAPSPSAMQAFLGHDTQISSGGSTSLPWRLGPAWMIEDALSAQALACMFLMGPCFDGPFTGHALRLLSDHAEAIATSLLHRSNRRGVDVSRVARRLRLNRLGQSSRRKWFESRTNSGEADVLGAGSDEVPDIASSSKKDATIEAGYTSSDVRKTRHDQQAFSAFVMLDCDLSALGNEILQLLGGFRLADEDVLFSINTKFFPPSLQTCTLVQCLGTEKYCPLDLAKAIPSLGGVTQVLFPLIHNAWRSVDLKLVLKVFVLVLRRNPACVAECLRRDGFALLGSIICERSHLVDEAVLKQMFRLTVTRNRRPNVGIDHGLPSSTVEHSLLVNTTALAQLMLCRAMRLSLSSTLQLSMIAILLDLLEATNPNAIFNARQLRRAGLVPWILQFLADLCSEPATLEPNAALEQRACFPVFAEVERNHVMAHLLALLQVFLHLENHIDDVGLIAEMLLYSRQAREHLSTTSPFRVVLLQFLLREIENGPSESTSPGFEGEVRSVHDGAEWFPATMVTAVFEANVLNQKKKKDRSDGGGGAVPSRSSLSVNAGSSLSESAIVALDTALLEVMRKSDTAFASLEAVLALRVLLSMAQVFPRFAQHLLHHSSSRFVKLMLVLEDYSTESSFYLPILAFLANIPIRETAYREEVGNGDGTLSRHFSLPTPCPLANPDRLCLDQVWGILSALLLKNCRQDSDAATRLVVQVLLELSYQVEVSEIFFAAVCHSGSTALQMIVSCLLCRDRDSQTASTQHGCTLQHMVTSLLVEAAPPTTQYETRALACFNFLRVFITRCLFEKDDFGMLMLLLLQCLDRAIDEHHEQHGFSLPEGQKSWLALLVLTIKATKALGDNCTFLVVRNLTTLSFALARYLADESKHHAGKQLAASNTTGAMDATAAMNCFGTDALLFLLSTLRACDDPHVAQVLGNDDQQFFNCCLVYCVQAVIMHELHGVHHHISPSPRFLDCVISSKALLVQQTKVSGVMICGELPLNAPVDADAAATSVRVGLTTQLNRMKSLALATHKEFGIGAESDRTFILAFTAELLRWLVDESDHVRTCSVALWQFLMQQRMGVLKELLIIEPKVSLLQNISASKKEVVDVYHGGFERLLQVMLPQGEADGKCEPVGAQESWVQFQSWLKEHDELLHELILARTDAILQHMIEVLLSCECIRKVAASSAPSRVVTQNDLIINLDFAGFESPLSPPQQEHTDDDEDAKYRVVQRKAIRRVRNRIEREEGVIREAVAWWRQTVRRMVNMPVIWHDGAWRSAYQDSDVPLCNDRAANAPSGACIEQTVFQQSGFPCELDATEGPHRLRLRVVRSFHEIKQGTADSSTYQDDERVSTPTPSNFGGRSTDAATVCEDKAPFVGSRLQPILENSPDPGDADNSLASHSTPHPMTSDQSSAAVLVLPCGLSPDSPTGMLCASSDNPSREMALRAEDFDSEDKAQDLLVDEEMSHFVSCVNEGVTLDAQSCTEDKPPAREVSNDSTSQYDRLEAFQIPNDLGICDAKQPQDGHARRRSVEQERTAFCDAVALFRHTCDEVATAPRAQTERVAIEVNERAHSLQQDAVRTNGSPGHVLQGSKIYDEFLSDPSILGLSVPTPILQDLQQLLNAADVSESEDTPAALLALFEVLVAAAAPTPSVESATNSCDCQSPSRPASPVIDADANVFDERDTTANAFSNDGDADSDASEHDEESQSQQERPDAAVSVRLVDSDAPGEPSIATVDQVPTHVRPAAEDPSGDDHMIDTSADEVYGAISRFFEASDFPPVLCYNATYVAGMSQRLGVFAVGPRAISFVGGYAQWFGDSETETNKDKPGVSDPVLGMPGSLRSAMKKRRKRDLIRDTFADMGLPFTPSKANRRQRFTVIALPSMGATTEVPDVYAASSRRQWCVKYNEIKQFNRVRYQLRPVGLEFFDCFGSTYFVYFSSQAEREEVVRVLFQMPIVNSIFWHPVLRSSALSLSIKRLRQACTKKWLKGQISNFDYLIHLNTLAGRSFNDLTQYPVFPWVLADYQSDMLDLDNAASFRDLSKPMGALGAERAALFRERFASMQRDLCHVSGPLDTAAFHYGTHYSCSAYVVNYLLRLEPFSQMALDLQGGAFDHADRLFRSIPSSWSSASRDNLQDVRELIPEFFFLPEFLVNAQQLDLGTTQGGEVVSHVQLPKWAHDDPREFIRLHRCALESKHVSEHLHEWIDLIFGYKQTGDAALDAQNVFMRMTYEGAIDLDAIQDEVLRNAMLAQIENFGQTPSQLFSSPHPARQVPVLLAPDSAISSSPLGRPYEGNTLSTIEAYVKWHTPLAPALVSIGQNYVFLRKQMETKVLDEAIGHLQIVNDKFQCRGIDCLLVPPRFSKFIEWGSTHGMVCMRSGAYHRDTPSKLVSVIEGLHQARVLCAAYSDDGSILVTGGEDAVVNIVSCSKQRGQRVFKQLAKLVGHDDAVVSVAISKEHNLVASGSIDCCVMLWDLRTHALLRELCGHSAPICFVAINGVNGNVLTTTASEMRLWSINGDLLAATTAQACGLSATTCAISTNCDLWQRGVVAATGHCNGTIALWGLRYPTDLHHEGRKERDADSASAKVAVAVGTRAQRRKASSSAYASTRSGELTRVVPSCQLFIMKLLMDHRAAVTALTIAPSQRQLFSGDADGTAIRWVDDSISPNSL